MRKSKKLRLKKTLFIFCEWETEKCYFEALRELRRSNINIKIEPFKFWQIWTTKSKIENDIDSMYEKINNEFSFNETSLKKTNSKIYLLLDTDSYSKQDINNIQNVFNKDDFINVLFSNQDFEIFILLHLEYFSWTWKDYINKIKHYYNDYEKGCCIKRRSIHKKIIELWLIELSKNIKKLKKLHIWKSHIKEMIPFSEVSKIYENI